MALLKITFPFFVMVTLLTACKKCPTTILCPTVNPTYFEIHGPDTARIFFPNIFTPNRDGINDLCKIYGKNIATINYKIYEGSSLVYTIDSLGGSWDGLINGQEHVNRYTAKVTGTTVWGTSFSLDGTVSLIDGAFLGSNTPAITQNLRWEVINSQFPIQNNDGSFNPNRPSNEYAIETEVIVCR